MTNKCSKCGIEIISKNNVKGYCRKCYYKTDNYKEYQRIKQNQYYHNNPKYKKRRDEYYARPEIQAKVKAYRLKYYEKLRLNKEQNDKQQR